jgi:hypothetical protein
LIFFKNAKDYLRAGNDDPAVPAWDLEMEEAWQRSWRSYWSHLDEIADRLGAKAHEFFRFATNEKSLRAGFVLSLNIGDSIGLDEASYSKRRFGEGPSTVALTILNYEKTRLHSFVFKGPRRVLVDTPSGDPLYFNDGKALGQIYLYEICSITPKYLSVEWLLDSGGTILIEFEKLIYHCKSIKIPQRKKRESQAR